LCVGTRFQLDDKTALADDRRDEKVQRVLSAPSMTAGPAHSDPVGR
jgi:hypothetical protein